MPSNKNIAGVVILYNPDNNVVNNILSYLGFVEKLYVVDNTDIENQDISLRLQPFPNVSYINNHGNRGIAQALNLACTLAEEDGFLWILTMDQDSCFSSGTFFEIFGQTETNGIGILAASYTNVYDRWVKPFNENFDEIHFVVTSGNLLNLKAWNEAGGFEEKLFIDEVDHDLCAKIRAKKYRILTSREIFLNHVVGLKLKSNEVNAREFEGHSPLRYYYIIRNTLFISKRYIFIDANLVYNRLRHLAKNLTRIILYYPEKRKYFKYLWKGISDFILGRFGEINKG